MHFLVPLGIKVIISFFIIFFHSFTGRHLRGILIAVLLFLLIPDFDNIIWMPMLAMALGIPIVLFYILWYAVGLTLLFIIWNWVHF